LPLATGFVVEELYFS